MYIKRRKQDFFEKQKQDIADFYGIFFLELKEQVIGRIRSINTLRASSALFRIKWTSNICETYLGNVFGELFAFIKYNSRF